AEPAPASRVPDARGGRGSLPDSTLRPVPDPGMQPPPAPQPDEGSLLESLLGLLDVLPSVVLGDAEDTPEATGGPQETSGPGEAALNAVPETVEPLLGQSTDAEQVPAGGLAPQVSAQVALPQPPSAAATGPSEEATAQPPVNVRQFPAPGIGSKPAPGGTLFQPEG
ncbi:MAG: hypothetical protein M3276_00905, partial [Actinomycetota bacterium]|nr:hypothetical protein [Actinomycetota bacterium]